MVFLNAEKPKSEQEAYWKGKWQLENGKYEKAIAFFDVAIEYNPNNSEVLLYRGIAKAEVGKTDEALVDINTSIAMNPEYGEPYLYLGLLKSKTGDYQGACENWIIAKEHGISKANGLLSLYCDQNTYKQQDIDFYRKSYQEIIDYTNELNKNRQEHNSYITGEHPDAHPWAKEGFGNTGMTGFDKGGIRSPMFSPTPPPVYSPKQHTYDTQQQSNTNNTQINGNSKNYYTITFSIANNQEGRNMFYEIEDFVNSNGINYFEYQTEVARIEGDIGIFSTMEDALIFKTNLPKELKYEVKLLNP